ncbi:UPF0146 family protein [Methanospirillum lacunae]|uniref:Uncharacterized protein n=1 Tax=Methanospirillum lacunae TaxID=668570 RepID=A0A2V2N1X5_9EURY|nr:UPF0146 family protein [Methanospirillum lacunae]PWR74112.1 hypothetical protein DK846_02855 [Methanospirillum lacunae]
MSGYKHIETLIARYIAGRYHSVLEIGTGHNTHAAELIQRSGISVTCSDLSIPQGLLLVPYVIFDVGSPDNKIFFVECILAIRPIEEMMSSLILYAQRCGADLLVYHLGFEGYSHPHQIINCGVSLCQYVTRQN